MASETAVFQERYRVAHDALNAASVVLDMSRLVATLAAHDGGAGIIIEGADSAPVARRVGLLASSMNPLTRAHVALAAAAHEAGRLDALYWVATAVTVDKESVERATLADRLVNARAYARATADGLLLLQGGLYVEQSRVAHRLLGDGTQITLIVGHDKIVQIFDRRYYADRDAALNELFDEAELLVAPRDGATERDLAELLARAENQPYDGHVRYCPLDQRYAHDSSTEARALAQAGDFSSRLSDLLTPEGLALATGPRPYGAERPPSDDDLGDVYRTRGTLLAALAALTPSELQATPALGELVQASGERSARGAALREWVTSPSPDAEGLWAALSK